MADCFFCGDFVGDESGDGGTKGRTIGNRDICEQCLAELKHHMNGIEAKSPSERKVVEDEDDEDNGEETPQEYDEKIEENDNPLSSGVKI